MKNYVEIDLTILEKEWIRQEGRMRRACDEHARAKYRVAEMKQELKVMKATVGKWVRRKPKKYGLSRATKDAVDDTVTLHPKVQRLERILIKRTLYMDLTEGAVTALIDRRKALEGATELHGQGYWAAPRQRKHYDNGEDMERARKRSIRQ